MSAAAPPLNTAQLNARLEEVSRELGVPRSSRPELSAVRELCVRTFAFHRAQEWPPLPLRAMEGWEPAYRDAREETEVGGTSLVLADVDSAREWFEQVLSSIDEAPR